MNRHHIITPSPVGELKLVAGDAGLVAVLWEHDDPARVHIGTTSESPDHPVLIETTRQLAEYFAMQRTVFTVELDFVGTDFQKAVWEALCAIPFGETRTYGQIADRIGNPGGVRAVGSAANRNPISIIAPCHRVVGASGHLTGFAGGLANKAFLLRMEDSVRNPTLW